MAIPVRRLPPIPKPISDRSTSLNYRERDPSSSSSGSSSPTSSDDPSISLKASEAHTLRSSTSLPNYAAVAVKFAPLPVIEPRKRKSHIQLGVAARSRMIQQRRVVSGQPRQIVPLWTELDEETAQQRTNPSQDEEEEDPFDVLGRYVVGKSKSLWRRVSQRAPGAEEISERDPNEYRARNTDNEKKVIVIEARPRSVSLDEGEEGRVWEEEVGENVQLQLQRISTDTQVAAGFKSGQPRTTETLANARAMEA